MDDQIHTKAFFSLKSFILLSVVFFAGDGRLWILNHSEMLLEMLVFYEMMPVVKVFMWLWILLQTVDMHTGVYSIILSNHAGFYLLLTYSIWDTVIHVHVSHVFHPC